MSDDRSAAALRLPVGNHPHAGHRPGPGGPRAAGGVCHPRWPLCPCDRGRRLPADPAGPADGRRALRAVPAGSGADWPPRTAPAACRRGARQRAGRGGVPAGAWRAHGGDRLHADGLPVQPAGRHPARVQPWRQLRAASAGAGPGTGAHADADPGHRMAAAPAEALDREHPDREDDRPGEVPQPGGGRTAGGAGAIAGQPDGERPDLGDRRA